MENPLNGNNATLFRNIQKLFESIEQVIKTRQELAAAEQQKRAAMGSPVQIRRETPHPSILSFFNFRNDYTLNSNSEIYPKLFRDLYDKYEVVILTGSDSWLKNDTIKLTIEPPKKKEGKKGKKDKEEAAGIELDLSRFYKIIDMFVDVLAKPIRDDFLLCLYRIFYSLALSDVTITKGDPDSSEAKALRMKKETLLHLCRNHQKSKESNTPKLPPGGGTIFDMFGQIMKREDMQKAITTGNIGAMAQAVTGSLNDSAKQFGFTDKIDGPIVGEVATAGEQFKEAIEKLNPNNGNPDMKDLLGIAVEKFAPLAQKYMTGGNEKETPESTSILKPSSESPIQEKQPKETPNVSKAATPVPGKSEALEPKKENTA
jgi:hypothetical protein